MTETLYDQAMTMYQRQEYAKLRAFKTAKKKSWTALGINAEMEDRIMAPINVRGTVTGRLPVGRGVAKTENQRRMDQFYAQGRDRFTAADIGVLDYTPREIHALKGQSSHGTISIVNQVVAQEKLRSDPRFPMFQIVERVKRYKAIFSGKPYQPIFA